jgi:hypothetical protein
MNEDSIVIQVVKMCGPHCVGIEEGASLFKQIFPILESGKKVCLDFKEVLTITSSFLNASIGKLVGQLENGTFEDRVKWDNLDEGDKQLIRLVISNAKEHFAKAKKAKKVEEDIIKDNHNKEDNV